MKFFKRKKTNDINPLAWAKMATGTAANLQNVFAMTDAEGNQMFVGTSGLRAHVVWGVTSDVQAEADTDPAVIKLVRDSLSKFKEMKTVGTYSKRDFVSMSLQKYMVLDKKVCVNAEFVRDALFGFEHQVALHIHPNNYNPQSPEDYRSLILGTPHDRVAIIMPLLQNDTIIATMPHFP